MGANMVLTSEIARAFRFAYCCILSLLAVWDHVLMMASLLYITAFAQEGQVSYTEQRRLNSIDQKQLAFL